MQKKLVAPRGNNEPSNIKKMNPSKINVPSESEKREVWNIYV